MSASARGVRSAALIFLLFPAGASAADLSFGGPSSVTVGSAISIPIVVSSSDLAINAISAEVSFPSDMFTIRSVKKSSLISFWTHEPAYSPEAGTASVEGVIFNPGWTGSSATVATLVLVPKRVGTGEISFTHASVLANDGQGTEVIKSSSGKTITVNPEPAQVPAAKPVVPAPAPEIATSSPATTTVSYEAPTIGSFTRVVDKDHPLIIVGHTVPGAQVEVLLSSCAEATALAGLSAAADCGAATSRSTTAGPDGTFALVWDSDISSGTHSFVVRAFVAGGATPASDPQTVVVQDVTHRSIALLILDDLALLFVVLLAGVGFVALALRLSSVVVRSWKSLRGSAVSRPLELFEGDAQMDGYIKVLERAAAKRALTEEEQELYTAMISHRAHPENPLVTRLTWVKR